MRVMSVVPSRYWAPVSTSSSPSLEGGVALGGGAVVYYGAVVAVSGDHIEAVAAVYVAGLGTLGLSAGPHVVFGDALIGILLHPFECAHQRHAVALHRFAYPGLLGGVFHGLEGLDWRAAPYLDAHHSLRQGVAYRHGVDEHRGAEVDVVNVLACALVGASGDAVGFEGGAHVVGELRVVNEEHALVARHIGEAYKFGGELDVVAAQVEEPGNLVECGDEDSFGSGVLHLLHSALELARHALAGIFHVVNEELALRALGAVVPYTVERGEVGGELQAVFAAEVLKACHLVD